MKKILLSLLCMSLVFVPVPSFGAVNMGDSVQEPHVDVSVLKMPVGAIISVQKEWTDCAKHGWLPCNGATYDKDTFPKLQAAIASVWGDGRLPNFQGAFLRGYKEAVSERYGTIQGSEVRNKIQDGTSFEVLTTSATNPNDFVSGGWSAQTLSSPAGSVKAKSVSSDTNDVWGHMGTGLAQAAMNGFLLSGVALGITLGWISGLLVNTKTYYIGTDAKVTMNFSSKGQSYLEEAKSLRAEAKRNGSSYQPQDMADWCDARNIYYEKTGGDLLHNYNEWTELINNMETYLASEAGRQENDVDAMVPTNTATYFYIKAR